jgi:hypothetical protein
MAKIELTRWSGSFDASEHRYYREDGKELQGVTGILHRRIFMDEYSSVSQEVLNAAAERGSLIHSRIELFDAMGVGENMPEVENYKRLCEENGLEWIASEYLVSDNENYASAIDKVYHAKDLADNEVELTDIKTTYRFNREYVAWQLSIYAFFFELMNPNLKVARLSGLWIREDNKRGSIAKYYRIERKPVEKVKELILCDLEDKPFNTSVLPSYIADNVERLLFLNERINTLTAEKDALVAEIQKKMTESKADSIDSGLILFTRVAAAKCSTFDSKRFKEENEALYNKYLRESVRKESLKLTIRK